MGWVPGGSGMKPQLPSGSAPLPTPVAQHDLNAPGDTAARVNAIDDFTGVP